MPRRVRNRIVFSQKKPSRLRKYLISLFWAGLRSKSPRGKIVFNLPAFFSLFGWRPRVALILERTRKAPLWPFKRYWQEIVAVVLLLALIGSNFFWHQPSLIQAATYTWVQTDWSGGASTTATAAHPDNQTGWSYYYEKGEDVAATSSVSLANVGGSILETSDADFQEGAFDKTRISGSGDSASIALFPPFVTTTTDDFTTTDYVDNGGASNIVFNTVSGIVKLARPPSWTHVSSDWLGADVGSDTSPAFADIDNDGDYDLAVGDNDGYVYYYRNDGTPSSPSWTHVSSNWLGVDAGDKASPAFADIDNDGDYDLAVGNWGGVVHYFRNDGTASSPSWTHVSSNWLGALYQGASPSPAFADIDNDGDYDLAVGLSNGYVYYYRNDGTASSPSWTHVSSNWLGVDVGYYAKPAFADIDNDGDYDLAVGDNDGYVEYFRNDGTPSSPSWTHVSSNWLPADVGDDAAPAFADIDNDGDYDLAVGDNDGYVEYFRNDSQYYSSGSFQSTNLLETQYVGSIESFSYYLSSLPVGITTSTVSFSQDGANWYDSSGNLNGWDAMGAGENTIDLSGLGWTGANFYYKMEFTSDGSDTPVLEWVKVRTNYPPSGTFVSQILDTGRENPLYTTLEFSATTTDEASVKIQLRADDSTSTLSSLDFVGPDGTIFTYYTSSGQQIWEGLSEKRYVQYKAILETTDNAQTPYFNEIKISFGISSSLISSPYNTSDAGNVLAKLGWTESGVGQYGYWRYRKKITLNSATPEDNYQVKVELTTSNFDYSKAEINGEDIRFSDAEGNTLYDYWIEEWDSSGTSTIWVEVPSSGASEFYIYYGNSAASAASNGTETFEFFDDFSNSSQWTGSGYEYSTSVAGYVHAYQLGEGTTESSLASNIIGTGSYAVGVKIKSTHSACSECGYEHKLKKIDDGAESDLDSGTYNSYTKKEYVASDVVNLRLKIYAKAVSVEGIQYEDKYSSVGCCNCGGSDCPCVDDAPSCESGWADAGITCESLYPAACVQIFGCSSGDCCREKRTCSKINFADSKVYIDDVYVRKYASSEPAVAGFDSEQEGEYLSPIFEGTEIKFQIRTAPDDGTGNPGAWSSWCGPDDADSSTSTCSTSTYFTDPSGGEALDEMFTDGLNDQWVQYRVFLSLTGTTTPVLSDVTLTYVVNAPPEFSTSSPPAAQQQSTGEVEINYSVRDPDTSQGTVQPNYVTPSFEYSLDGGVSWSSIDCSYMASGDCDNKFVEEVNFTDYTATWDAKSQIGQEYSSNAKIRISLDDKEAANNTAQTSTSPFELDTKNPQNPQIVVDASTQYGTNDATLYPSVSDDTISAGIRGSMMISTTSSFSGASWQDYAASTTFNLPSDPSTVYIKFKDSYGNVSAVASVTSPPTPDGVYCQDVSNTDEGVYRLFVGWSAVDLPPQGDFDRYLILKSTSTDPGDFEQAAEITDRTQNYWMDSNVEYGTTYYYQVLSKDTLGDISFRSQMASGAPGSGGEDTLPPSFVSGPASSEIYTTQATISWETDELSRAILHYGVSSGNYTMSKSVNTYATSHSAVLAGLNASATYYLMVEAIDTSDNSATSSEISFSTLSGPVISNVAVSQVFNEKATIFWLTDISADSYVYYSTSTQGTFLSTGNTESVTQHEITIENLESGARYYFYVKSSNALDNNEGQYHTFVTTNDTKPPEISNLSAWTTAYTAVIVWQTDELSDSKIEWGTSSGSYNFSTTSDVYTISHAVKLTNLVENQTYYYKVTSKDVNDNQTQSVERTFVPIREKDTTPPVISGVATSSVYTTQAEISWTTDELADSQVEYSTDPGFSTYEVKTNSSMVTSHSLVLTGLTPDTSYYFRVKSKDIEDNQSTKEDSFSFTTLSGPVISDVVVSQVFNDQATIEWQTDIPATSTVVYSSNPDFSAYFVSSDADSVSVHQITLTDLSIGTIYYFYVKSGSAVDDNGGNYYYFSTANDADSPQISNISSFAKENSGLILWETDELSNSKVVYGTTTICGSETSLDNTLTKKHAVSISGLSASTTYYYRAVSCDANSNCATSSLNSFTTLFLESPKESDAEGPQISEVKAAVVSDTSAVITWTTDELADSKVVFGTSLDYGSETSDSAYTVSHSVTLSNLTKKTSYYFKVVSKDASGNETVDDNSGEGYTFTTTDEPGIVETITQGGGGILIIEKAPEGYKSEKEWCEEMGLYWYDGKCHRIAGEETAGLTREEEESLSLIESGTGEFLEKVLEKIKRNPHLQNVKEGDLLSAVSEMAEKVVTPPQLTGRDYPKVIKGTDFAKIIWMTDKKSNSLVAIAEDKKYNPAEEEPYQMVVGNPDELVTYHQVLVENLKPSTLYHFQVRSKPLIGPAAKSEDRTFATLGLSLEISDISTKRKGPGEIEIFFRTNLPAKTELKYKNLRTNEEKEISDNSFVGEHRISLADLLANTEYSFLIKAEDEKGQKAASPEIRFSTGKDTEPPRILEVKTSSAISPRGQVIQTVISWRTDELSTSRVYYVEGIKWDDKLAKSTPMDNSLSIRHIVVLPKLKPGKVYLFKTESIDSSQNRSFSETYTLFTPQRRKTIIQIMMSQFEKTFGWIKNVGI